MTLVIMISSGRLWVMAKNMVLNFIIYTIYMLLYSFHDNLLLKTVLQIWFNQLLHLDLLINSVDMPNWPLDTFWDWFVCLYHLKTKVSISRKLRYMHTLKRLFHSSSLSKGFSPTPLPPHPTPHFFLWLSISFDIIDIFWCSSCPDNYNILNGIIQ